MISPTLSSTQTASSPIARHRASAAGLAAPVAWSGSAHSTSLRSSIGAGSAKPTTRPGALPAPAAIRVADAA